MGVAHNVDGVPPESDTPQRRESGAIVPKKRFLVQLGATAIVAAFLASSATVAAAKTPEPAHPVAAKSSAPVLSATPYMGWNTYYGLGGDFDASQVLAVADKLVDSGMAKAGYNIVWLDGGWQSSTPRGTDGLLQADPTRFPDGLASLVTKLHERGLKAGIYTDAGPYIPGSCGLGSYGHYQTDADTFAKWGFDAVKVDFLCGITANLDPKTVFTEFSTALRHNSSGRPMIFNLCNPVTSPDWGNYPESQQSTNSWTYAPAIAESWRTYTDAGFVGMLKYSDMLRNFDANARHPEAAGPGHWNDPDYLGPELGMTDEEFRTQMTLWSISAAPLILASDPKKLSATSLATLTDPDVLAVDQDSLGVQGTRVGAAGTTETWVKPLRNGSKAVVLLNRGDAPAEVSTTATAVGLAGHRFTVSDAWKNDVTESAGVLRASVPAHGAALLTVEVQGAKLGTPRLVVSPPNVTAVDGTVVDGGSDLLAASGAKLTVATTVYNDGTTPALTPDVKLSVPAGWSSVPSGRAPLSILPGRSATFTFTVSVAATAPAGQFEVTASLRFRALPRNGTAVSAPMTVTIAPTPPHGETVLSHHPWISATSGWMTPQVDGSVGGGSAISIAGVGYATGIGVATPSAVRYFLGGACTKLAGVAGIDDAVKNVGPEGGTATFTIVGDGKTLFSSATVVRDQTVALDVDVTGVRDLRLEVGDAGDGGYNDRADWGALTVSCAA